VSTIGAINGQFSPSPRPDQLKRASNGRHSSPQQVQTVRANFSHLLLMLVRRDEITAEKIISRIDGYQ